MTVQTSSAAAVRKAVRTAPPKDAFPSEGLPEGLPVVADALHDAMQLTSAAAINFAHEPHRFASTLMRDYAEAVAKLAVCHGPLDVMAVSQAYLLARSQAWLDSGFRLFQTCVTCCDAGTAQAADPAFILPE